jgi:hypothetical protein
MEMFLLLGEGDESNQFHHPTDLAFDSQGNLYVSDAWNHRVQFFAMINNDPCQETSTVLVTTTTSTVLTTTTSTGNFTVLSFS